MNNFAAAGLGCIAALALWKGTKERWIPSLLGIFVIVVTVKFADKYDDFGWLIGMVGSVVFTAGVYGLKRWDARIANLSPGHILKPNAPETPKEEDDEELLNTTDEKTAANHGWEHWSLFPKTKKLIHDLILGGPPRFISVYEYEVRDESVFVRLIEQSKDTFDGPEYTVFKGSIIQEQIEKEYKKDTERWKEADPETQALLVDTQEKAIAKLQRKMAWHEMNTYRGQGWTAAREFVLSKGVVKL